LHQEVVIFEQTGALWRLIVIIAVSEEGRFVVSLMVSLLSQPIEKRGYCSVARARLRQSASEVVHERVRSERPGASAFEPRLGHLYLSEA
jgi:hypothetical protein